MLPTLKAKVGVFTIARNNMWDAFGFHVVNILLIRHIYKHSYTFNGVKTNFLQEDRIGSISLDIKV